MLDGSFPLWLRGTAETSNQAACARELLLPRIFFSFSVFALLRVSFQVSRRMTFEI